jgi:hypothetical protein
MKRLLAMAAAAVVAVGIVVAGSGSAAMADVVPDSHQVVVLTAPDGHRTTVVANQSPAPGQPALLELYRVAPAVMTDQDRLHSLEDSLCWDSYSCFFADANGGGQLVRLYGGQGVNDLTQITCPVSLGCNGGTFNDSLSSWASGEYYYTGYIDAYDGCPGGQCWNLYETNRGVYANTIPAANDRISSLLG